MTPPDASTFSAILRVEDAPDWHPELTRELGRPATCFSEPAEARGSLWTWESHYVTGCADDHLEWAGDLVTAHEPLFVRLVSAGVRVVVQLACDCDLPCAIFCVDPRLFAPFIRVGIPVEFCTTLTATPVP